MATDILDIASDLTELQNQLALRRHQAAQSINKDSAFYCVECDEVIPHKRRMYLPGVQTCVDCQSTLELKKK